MNGNSNAEENTNEEQHDGANSASNNYMNGEEVRENNNEDNDDDGLDDDDLDDEELNNNRYRVEISFSSGMSPVPIEAKTSENKDNLEEITLAQNVMHKYRVKVWRDRLDHTLPVEHLVVIQDLTFPEFENMIKGVLSKVKESDMGNAWSHVPGDSASDRDIDGKRSKTPSRRSSRGSRNSRPTSPQSSKLDKNSSNKKTFKEPKNELPVTPKKSKSSSPQSSPVSF